MTSNPYQPPEAPLRPDAQIGHATSKLYSPRQVAGGAFLGGPAGVVYFLAANFRALRKRQAMKIMLSAGGGGMLVLLVAIHFLPERFPYMLLNIAYVIVAYAVALKFQHSKQEIADSDRFAFHSNWRVIGLSLLCFVASLLVVVVLGFGIERILVLANWYFG